MRFFDINIKNGIVAFKRLIISHKVFIFFCFVSFVLGVILALRNFNNQNIIAFIGGEYTNVYVFASGGNTLGKIILSGLFTVVCNLAFVIILGFSKYLTPLGLFALTMKIYCLTKTFISFYKMLDLINLICLFIILVPFELLMLAVFILGLLTALENTSSCKGEKVGAVFKIYAIKQLALFVIMFLFYCCSILIIKISVNIFYVNFI